MTDDTMQRELSEIFAYLGIRAVPSKADVIVGFGHFDLNIPRQCLQLYREGFAGKIIFTGGVGAGSARFTRPEALEFKSHLLEQHPDFPSESDMIIEDQSTNTGENLRFTQDLLRKLDPRFNFGRDIRRALIVCTPARQRRVYHTCRHLFPETEFLNCPPATHFSENVTLFADNGQCFREQLLGEVERLLAYPDEGFIEPVSVPDLVMGAYNACRSG